MGDRVFVDPPRKGSHLWCEGVVGDCKIRTHEALAHRIAKHSWDAYNKKRCPKILAKGSNKFVLGLIGILLGLAEFLGLTTHNKSR